MWAGCWIVALLPIAALLGTPLEIVGVAFIVAAGVSFALFLIGLPIVQIGLSPETAGLIAQLSVLSHFENVARGVIDLRDVLYFLSMGGLFVMLAWTAVARERLSSARPEFGRLRLGAGVVIALVIMAAPRC